MAATPVQTLTTNVFYVSPQGTPGGDGSIERPWGLATALAQPKVIKPGAIIWLRGGTYQGPFTSLLKGAQASPITVRSYPGEWAILDGVGSTTSTLLVKGTSTIYRDFEVMNSGTNRLSKRATGVYVNGSRTKFINLIVHDTGLGIAFYSGASDSELYGNIIYNGGWDESDRGHGPGIYAQNQTGVKRIADNIVFNQFSHGIQIYGSSTAYLDNIYLEGNAFFRNGTLSREGFQTNIHIGGGRIAQNPTLIQNYTYFTPNQGGRSANLAYQRTTNNANVRDNYFAGGLPLQLGNSTNPTVFNNTFYGNVESLPSRFPNNTYYLTRPTGVKVVVRPNQYEQGRANLIFYNWDLLSTVEVDVSSILPVGASYEVRNAQDFNGAPVQVGTYDGRPLRLPMSGLNVAQPIGYYRYPGLTGPEFNAFVLISR